MQIIARLLQILLLLTLPASSLGQTQASFPAAKLSKYLQDSRAKYRDSLQIGVHLREERTGKELFAYNATNSLIPASVAKVVTSVVALKMLGGNYRFPTEVYVERLPNAPVKNRADVGNVGRLYVRGYGDPSFVQENLILLARGIKELGVGAVSDIVVDASLFVDPRGPIGARPYEAGLSALSLNHNCYEVFVAPTVAGAAPLVTVAPGANVQLQNSLTTAKGKDANLEFIQAPESRVVATNLEQGVIDAFRSFAFPELKLTVRGSVGEQSKGDRRYFTVPSPPLYFGASLKSELAALGVKVSGEVLLGEVPESANSLKTVYSKDLAVILRDLNFYSNNFTADQILYALGQDNLGLFRKDLALERITEFFTFIGLDRTGVVLLDGSGLDRGNRLTAQHLTAVLSYAANDLSIAPDFISSLSRFGKTGTLKERRLGKEEARRGLFLEGGAANSVWGKTGTLNGVSSIVGYIQSVSGERYSYAILINGSLAKDAATTIENNIIKIAAGI